MQNVEYLEEQSSLMMEKSYQRHLNHKNTISKSCPTNAEIFSSLSSRSALNNLTTNTTHRLSNMNCSRILPGLSFPLKLLLISSCIGIFDVVQSWEFSAQLSCMGYNYPQFKIVDHICDDCYDEYRELELYKLCRQNCFTSFYFKDCLEVLSIPDARIEELKEHIRDLNGVYILNEIPKENSKSGEIEETVIPEKTDAIEEDLSTAK